MRRVVVTGMGIVSCLGNSLDEVLDSLKNGKSGIRFNETYKDKGFRSQVSGSVDVDTSVIDRKVRRFMGPAAMYSYLAMEQAIAHAGLTEDQISNDRTGLIAGSGGASCSSQVEATDTMRERGVKRIGPYMVPRIMTSTVSACLATAY
ncbi:MAG: beta-ketoacyl-ACP synthase I, partial [Marinobacter sp.]|nr:beta-ketoacyl-ACP synthase I [Marinobacter sp.]